MNDSWLDRGHGVDPAHLDTIFTSAARNLPPGIGETPGGADQPSPAASGSSRRSSRVLVMIALWFGIIVGTSGAAWAVRDALFPSIGPSEVSVWQNPGHQTEPTITDDPGSTSSTTGTTTTSPGIIVPSTDDTTTVSVDDHGSSGKTDNSVSSGPGHNGTVHTDSTVTSSSEQTSSSVDDHGGGGGNGGGGGSGSDGGSGSGGGTGSSGGSGSGGGGGSNSGGGG